MFSLIFAMLLSLNSSAGVGGISGGHVYFQRDSAYVPPWSKSLCHNNFEFKAVINKCAKWHESGDSSTCVEFEKVESTQPMESTYQRCKKTTGTDQKYCEQWETAKLFQGPVRTVNIVEGSDNKVVGTKKMVVPECN